MMNARPVRNFGLSLLYGIACCGALGCTKLVPTEGIVTMDGKPLEGGSVLFFPEKRAEGTEAAGPILQGGRFRMNTNSKEGVWPGKYKVTVSSYEVLIQDGKPVATGKQLMPPKYIDPATTPFSVEVSSSGKTDIKLEIGSEPSQQGSEEESVP